MKQVSSILKRGGNENPENTDIEHEEEDEEESAYNEHFKNNSAPPGPGEFRVPSVRVRANPGPANTPNTSHTDYTGTALAQGKYPSLSLFCSTQWTEPL